MTQNDNLALPDLAFFISLESQVWEALVSGDKQADAALLTPGFLGVYPSGFSNRDEHADQLNDGPVMQSFDLDEARLMQVGGAHALLCYRADFQRYSSDVTEVMYISSLWELIDGHWLNIFSQDTPAA